MRHDTKQHRPLQLIELAIRQLSDPGKLNINAFLVEFHQSIETIQDGRRKTLLDAMKLIMEQDGIIQKMREDRRVVRKSILAVYKNAKKRYYFDTIDHACYLLSQYSPPPIEHVRLIVEEAIHFHPSKTNLLYLPVFLKAMQDPSWLARMIALGKQCHPVMNHAASAMLVIDMMNPKHGFTDSRDDSQPSPPPVS